MNQDKLPPNSLDFLDTTNKTQLTNFVKPQITEQLPVNYLTASENIWKQKGLLNAYQKGTFFGKGDVSNIFFTEFIKKFRKLYEEIVREELREKNITFESFKDDFKTFETLNNMIQHHLKDHEIEIKNERNIAILHGFINAYIDSLISTSKHV